MYEKNCLTYSCLKHIEQSPYTIVLQMHPSASQEKKEFMQKLYEIEPNVKLQHISVKSVKKTQNVVNIRKKLRSKISVLYNAVNR